MERIQRLLNLEPRGFRFPAPLLSFGLAFSASLGLAWQPTATFILRQIHPKATEVVVQPAVRELEGAVAALREPTPVPVLSELVPVPAPDGSILADGSTRDLAPILVPGTPTVALVREETKPEPIPGERLGIPYHTLFGTPFEPWPLQQEQVVEAKLPRPNPWLEDVLVKPQWKPYAFTTWPRTSTHSRRLFRFEVPARSKVTFRVEGTSGGKADPYFYLMVLHGRSLVERRWTERDVVTAAELAVINAMEVPISRVLVITGPEATAYRCSRIIEPLGCEHPAQPVTRVPVEAWPLPGEGLGSVDYAMGVGLAADWVRFEPAYIDKGVGRVTGNAGADSWEAASSGGSFQGESLNHLRCVRVILAAGEQARFRVKGHEGLRLEVAQPIGTEAPSWVQAIQEANADPTTWRARRLIIRNPTALPQTFVLVVTSSARRAEEYRITRERLDSR